MNDIIRKRILPNVLVVDTGCWEWQGYLAKTGYGEISVNGKRWLTHRLVYTLSHGDIEKGMVVRHTCDNRKCCNPDHLLIGTHSENRLDYFQRRVGAPDASPARKQRPKNLTDEQLVEWVRDNIATVNEHGCWLTERAGPSGYNLMSINNKTVATHRYLYCLKTGLDYDDKSYVARHTCHHKQCVNPDHIIHGSQRDNALDSRSRYRHTVLTEEKVRAIIIAYTMTDFNQKGTKKAFVDEQAQKYGVSHGAIFNIITGCNWTDVTAPYLRKEGT